MYIFPRQFGLHNVFTSPTDSSRTTQKLQDYTTREEAISKVFDNAEGRREKPAKIHIPKRLRGDTKRLVQRLQILHGRCSYAELLRRYCPTVLDGTEFNPTPQNVTTAEPKQAFTSKPPATTSSVRHSHHKDAKSRRKSRQSLPLAMPTIRFELLTDLATPVSSVSAFCQAVLSRIIPDGFWGAGTSEAHNKAVILRKVDHFIKLRRFESMSLHEVVQGLKVSSSPDDLCSRSSIDLNADLGHLLASTSRPWRPKM
jgi:telomerase reverse transcriptase